MKIKYIVGAALFLFFVVITALVVAGLLSSQKEKQLKETQPIEIATTSENNTSMSSTTLLTVAEVEKHNSQANCWMTINNKVYDLTSFFGSHPGGDKALMFNCGTDATIAFNTQGGKGSHPQSAVAMLPSFYIGDIGGVADIETLSKIKQLPSLPRDREDDDD